MKKAWRWVLGSLAAVIVLFALFVWDAIHRAEAAIDAHERQVALDIAALRAAHARRPPPPPDLPRSFTGWSIHPRFLEEIADLNESGTYFRYESEDNPDPRSYLYLEQVAIMRVAPAPPPHEVLSRLAAAQDQFRGGGFDRAYGRQCIEGDAIRHWKRLIETRQIPPHTCQRFIELMEELQRRRPSVRESIEEERTIHRLRVIQVLRSRADKHGTLREAPGWPSLFLWRLFIAKTLSSTNRMYRVLDEIALLPSHEREDAARRALEANSQFRVSPSISKWGNDIPGFFSDEAAILRSWTLMRIATATVWFKSEQGGYPRTLHELTPKYIDRIPLDPVTGLPFSYSSGSLIGGVEPGEKEVWDLAK